MKVTESVLQQMIRHAITESPKECCGLLSGSTSVIRSLHLCRNELDSVTAFRIAPEQLFEYFRQIRTTRTEFMGIYHSHPKIEAKPSFRDTREFYYFGASYWIISLAETTPEVKSFGWKDGAFHKIEYEIVRE